MTPHFSASIASPQSRSLWVALCLGLITLLLSGCGKMELFSQMSENEANAMIAILLQAGIDTDKKAGKDNMYSLSVDKENFAEAVSLLRLYGFPKEHFQGLGTVFAKSGLVSSPTEERIRFMYALAQSMEETLSQIDGVVLARVHIVLPAYNPYAEVASSPSAASVFIKFRESAKLDAYVPQIKALVVNSVEGLSYDNVTLALFPVNEPPEIESLGAGKSSKTQGESSYTWLVIGGLVLAALAGGAVYYTLRFQRKKQAVSEPLIV